jgi:hypothetical protein
VRLKFQNPPAGGALKFVSRTIPSHRRCDGRYNTPGLAPEFGSRACPGVHTCDYNFQNTLNEAHTGGPALTVLGTAGNYEIDTLNEIGGSNKTVYRFETNNGVQFNNTAAGHFLGETYTIELYFVFDELNSWKRVVDWKNRKTDWGAYVYYGQLNFFNILYSTEAPVAAGEYTYYVITRDSATKQVLIYTDADVKINFVDTDGDAIIDNDGVLNFFYDDLIVQNEASSGAVATLKLYNYAVDSATIRTNWNTIGSTVFGMNDQLQAASLKVFPNPASTQIYVDLSGFEKGEDLQLSVVNQDGQLVYNQTALTSTTPFMIATASWTKGVYYIRIQGNMRYSSSKILIK